jgi:hypothetical protein
MVAAWARILEDIDRDLRQAELAIREGLEVPTLNWSPPDKVGPMPGELHERARQLLARHERLQEAGRTRLGGFTQDLSGLKLRHEAASAYAVADQSRG